MASFTDYLLDVNLISRGASQGVPISGRALAPVVTERGEANKLYYVSSEDDYVRRFGRPKHSSSKELVHYLREGAAAQIVPIYHYSDIVSDANPVGTKASVASGTVTITAKEVGGGYNGCSVIITASQADAVNLVNIEVRTPEGYSQPFSNFPKILTTPDTEALNDFFEIVNFGTGTLTTGTFVLSGGVRTGGTKATATVAGIDFEAKSVGSLVNGTTITISDGTLVDTVKITVTKGSATPEVLDDVPETLTLGVKTDINNHFTTISIVDSTGTLTNGTATFTGGTEDTDGVVAADVIGSAGNKRGVYKLKEADQDSVLIKNLFAGYANVEGTFDEIAKLTFRRHIYAPPVNLSVSQIETALSNTTAKSPYTTHISGGVRAIDPLTNVRAFFTGIGKVGATIMRKNAVEMFLSAARYEFSTVYGVSDVVNRYDQDEINRLQAAGSNFLQNRGGKITYEGAWTTNADKTQPISNEAIADLSIYLIRFIASQWGFFRMRTNNRSLRKDFSLIIEREMERLKRIDGGVISGFTFTGEQEVENKDSPNKIELNQGIWKPTFIVEPISGLRQLIMNLELTFGANATVAANTNL